VLLVEALHYKLEGYWLNLFIILCIIKIYNYGKGLKISKNLIVSTNENVMLLLKIVPSHDNNNNTMFFTYTLNFVFSSCG
jgi:hypothetical protein